MALGNITSANATAILVVQTVFPAGFTLEQFATDQSLSMDEIVFAETRKGIDGVMAAGFIPAIYPVTVMLEASSPSTSLLAQLGQAMTQSRTIYDCTLTCRIPSIGKTYVWSGGVLKAGKPFPDNKKVLDPTTWKFDFDTFNVSAL